MTWQRRRRRLLTRPMSLAVVRLFETRRYDPDDTFGRALLGPLFRPAVQLYLFLLAFWRSGSGSGLGCAPSTAPAEVTLRDPGPPWGGESGPLWAIWLCGTSSQ